MSESEVFLEPAEHLGLAKDYYLISNLGRIWSRSLEKFLVPTANPNGYVTPFLVLTTRAKRTCYTHILVMETFHNQRTPDGMVIDHINQDKGDNRLSNLRFATLSENVNNRDWGNHGVGQKKAVLRYNLNLEYLDEWPSAKEAMQKLSLPGYGQIASCCLNKVPTAYGYIWKYKETAPLPGEVWKSLYGVEVSNYGRTKSAYGVVSYGNKTNNHYYGVMREGVSYLVHRIVCEAFNGASPPGKDIVDHLDGDKLNNRADNLQWVSHSENIQRALGREVARVKDEVTETFASIAEAIRATGRDREAILRWCREGVVQDGYTWKFASEEDTSRKRSGVKAKTIVQYTLDGTEVRRFDTMIATCLAIGKNRTTLRKYINLGTSLDGYIYKVASE